MRNFNFERFTKSLDRVKGQLGNLGIVQADIDKLNDIAKATAIQGLISREVRK